MQNKAANSEKMYVPNMPLVLLNTPIHDEDEDILGFHVQVNSLQAAIDSNAQMIAITSPFGAGKSSVIELLRKRKANQKIISVSMWSQLCKAKDSSISSSTIDLHRSLIYQISSKLNNRNGAYISHRLNKSYGLLRLHAENLKYYICTFLSLLFFLLGYIFPEVLKVGLPPICGTAEMWNSLLIFVAVALFAYVVTRAEIVFSSNKSEGSRIIDENELVELYRKFVIEYCKNRKRFNKRENRVNKYIVVIEDLDRTDETECVITFLKELRKYYMQDNVNNEGDVNIVFVVNVKPESSLFKNSFVHKSTQNESLYAKLFDYVLNIPTINIEDYETVLESILKQNKLYIERMLPNIGPRMIDIPGMQWIIRGKNFGVRDIKDRLNRAFTLYSSLINKFEPASVSFEKCAVVAYLTTAYEKEFLDTKDNAFGTLVEANMQHILNKETCHKTLNVNNDDYVSVVLGLVQSKFIDSNYKMYFYNYPKNSRILSYEESVVQEAILYGDITEDINDMVVRVSCSNAEIIYNAFDRIKKLKIPLPEIVFRTEALYIEALQHYPTSVYEWLTNLDYSPNAHDKLVSQIISVLSLDSNRNVYSSEHALQFCKVWETKFSEDALLAFRNTLCSCFMSEIQWYRSLFFGVHNIVSIEELDKLELNDIPCLIDTSKDDFNVKYVEYTLSRFDDIEEFQPAMVELITNFLVEAEDELGSTPVAPYLLQFMNTIQTIIPAFESSVMSLLTTDDLAPKVRDKLFQAYQKIINTVAKDDLNTTTINNIHILGIFDGYNETVAELLEKNGYLFDATILRLNTNLAIDFHDSEIIAAIKANLSWLQKSSETFEKLRLNIIKCSDEKSISNYKYLFSNEFVPLSDIEFALSQKQFSTDILLSLLPASIITKNELPRLLHYFNKAFYKNSVAYAILKYISQMPAQIAKECFYNLNFDGSIKYSTFAAYRKNNIKRLYNSILNLDSTVEKIKFMHATKWMDSAWEDNLCGILKGNDSLQADYINAINNAAVKSITASTIKCICSFSKFHGLNDNITMRLYRAKKYTHYVISKTLYHEQFILDNKEMLEILWPTYIEIFLDPNCPNISEHMGANCDFLRIIMENGDYVDFPAKQRMALYRITQNGECLKDAATYGYSFCISYYSSITGFVDESAQRVFLSIIESNSSLLQSQQIYDHSYPKLSSSLKAKYTRARSKHGYM